MKNIEIIKFICGLTLVSFAIFCGIIFYLESFNIVESLLNYTNLSGIFEGGWVSDSGGGASNIPIFFGLCGLAGAYLLVSVKSGKTEIKTETSSDQSTN